MPAPPRIPREVEIRGIYVSPLLLAAILGVGATWLTCRLLNQYGLAERFEQPVLVYLSLAVIYTILIGTFLIPS